MNRSEKPHVVAVPFPGMGHFIPFLDLAKLLASHGLTVSYVTTPANVSRLQGYLDQGPDNDALDIRLVALPPPLVEGLHGCESTDLLRAESGLIFQLAMKLQDPFDIWMEQQFHHQTVAAPVCIVYDIFMGWAVDTAQKFNIASFLFNTCGAFATSLLHSLSCSIFDNTLEKDEEDESLVVSFNMPRTVRLGKNEVSPVFFNTNPLQSFARQCYLDIGKGSGMLINTFHALEPLYVQHLKTLTAKPVWAIGPVNPQFLSRGAGNIMTRGKMADINEEELVSWLDSRSPRSVIYVSFGSYITLAEEQTHALARGLEASEQPFVWTIKVPPKKEPSSSSSDSVTDRISTFLPEGFVERTKGRGLIIRGWAPQLVILSHPSVGAFISHCGWNSALESVSLGVPILAWPMAGDQHFNSKLFAELGVGIQFCQNKAEIPKEESIKKAVTMALLGDKREEMREGAEKLKLTASDAVKLEGSSATDLRAFVNEMHKLNTG